MTKINVPLFRPELREQEIDEVVATLRSGWLTTGPLVKRFEQEFATAVGATYAVAINSCTAALHLAVEALGLKPGQAVLVPTMTFASTAEVVRYQGAIPILVDCDPITGNMDLGDCESRLERCRATGESEIVGIMPVHVGGLMIDLGQLRDFAKRHGLWIVEDAAHAFPSGWRADANSPWQQRSNGSNAVTCYSFYANKTITTGEGGMALTNDAKLAQRMRLMSLHGLSHDAWGRFSGNGNWDYKIVAPGFKYNLTDIAAAIGVHQLKRADAMRTDRELVAKRYLDGLANTEEIGLPPLVENRIHAWHLFPIKLRLNQLTINRNEFMKELKAAGVGCSVHWRPLHRHPYYQKAFGWRAGDFPVASALWKTLISLPIFPGMRPDEIDHVIATVKEVSERHSLKRRVTVSKTLIVSQKRAALKPRKRRVKGRGYVPTVPAVRAHG